MTHVLPKTIGFLKFHLNQSITELYKQQVLTYPLVD